MHLYHVQHLAPLRKTQNSLHLLKWGHWFCSSVNFTKQCLEPPWQQVEAGPNLQLCNGRGNCIYAIKQPSNLTRGCTCTQLKVQPLQAKVTAQIAAFHDKSMNNQSSTVICFQRGALRAASTMLNRGISPTSPCSCTSPTAVAHLDPIWLPPNKPCYTPKWMLSLIFSLLVNASGKKNNLQDKKT
jgi:hypothetical protein